MQRFEGRVVAVTGGASGIGEATARRAGAEGARVAIADRDGERGEWVVADLQGQGVEALFVAAQMEREDAAADFVQRTVERFGRLDVLVNNAGIRLYQTVVEASAESWDAILGVNVKSYAFCAKAAIPVMRQNGGGSIVNVASIRAVTAGGNMTQYDTSKAAVAGLTRGSGDGPRHGGHPGQRRVSGADLHALPREPGAGGRQDARRVQADLRGRRHAAASGHAGGGGGLHPVPGLGRRLIRHRHLSVRRRRDHRSVANTLISEKIANVSSRVGSV